MMNPQRVAERLAIARPSGVEQIDVVPLDELIGDRFVTAVKVDVEGFEIEVLEGAQRLLAGKRVGYLQIENNKASRMNYGRVRRATWELLARHGYIVYGIRRGGALVREPDLPRCPEVIAVAPLDFFWTRLSTADWAGMVPGEDKR